MLSRLIAPISRQGFPPSFRVHAQELARVGSFRFLGSVNVSPVDCCPE
jgi:hypothetical protein